MGLVYLPSRDYNSLYRYKIQENSFKVYTNYFRDDSHNSVTCYEVYPHLDYLKGNDEVCTITEMNSADLDYQHFTTDFWYRIDLSNILFIFLVLSIFIVFIPYKIISRWFGRWLKV